MNNKKLLIVGLTIVMLLTACGISNNVDLNNLDLFASENVEALNYLDDQIVFIKQYSNWAEGYQYFASYVTANGNVYSYSYDGDYSSEPYKIGDVLDFPRDEVNNTISSKEMKKLISSFEKVGDIEFTEESFGCDFGQDSVYGVKYDEQNNAEFIYLGSFGDNHYIPNDKYAKKICQYFGLDWD